MFWYFFNGKGPPIADVHNNKMAVSCDNRTIVILCDAVGHMSQGVNNSEMVLRITTSLSIEFEMALHWIQNRPSMNYQHHYRLIV